MEFIYLFLIGYILLFLGFTYIMICGNNNFHRNGIVGSIFRFFNVKIPNFFKSTCFKCIKTDSNQKEDDGCLGPGGPCRYFTAIFFYGIYMFFTLVYLFKVYPNL